MRLRRYFFLILIACILGGLLVVFVLPRMCGCGSFFGHTDKRAMESRERIRAIYTAMVSYSGNYDRFPLAGQALIRPGMSDADAAKVTALTCEMLAAALDLPPKLFKCPTASEAAPPPPRPFTGTDWSGATPGGWEVAAPGRPGVSYAIDWAAPGDAATKSTRVWISERSPAVWGGRGVQVCFGDGHTGFLKASPGRAGRQRTWGSPADLVVINPDSAGPGLAPDNIFDGLDDGALPSTTRARVR
jgi:hypothetical protein